VLLVQFNRIVTAWPRSFEGCGLHPLEPFFGAVELLGVVLRKQMREFGILLFELLNRIEQFFGPLGRSRVFANRPEILVVDKIVDCMGCVQVRVIICLFVVVLRLKSVVVGGETIIWNFCV